MDAHYLQLEAEVKAEKENDRQRSNKKDIKYITNSEHRRVTYSRRSHSLVLAAKELEVQTHCSVSLEINPTWPNGKGHQYRSQGTLVEPNRQKSPEKIPETSKASDQPSPLKRKNPKAQACARPTLVSKPTKAANQCRVCGDVTESSFWLGCGFTNPKTRRQDCTYWVHQNCIGLYYKQRHALEKVPFYCKKHAPK